MATNKNVLKFIQKKKANTKIRKVAGIRTPAQKERDLAFIAKSYLQGRSARQIVNAINEMAKEENSDYTISYSTVTKDICYLNAQWAREQIESIEKRITRENKKIDLIEKEAWEAWEKSKKAIVKIIDPENPNEIDEDYIGSGNSKFLDILIKANKRRAELNGYEAPSKFTLPGATNNNLLIQNNYDFSNVPEELILQIADMLQGIDKKQLTDGKEETKDIEYKQID